MSNVPKVLLFCTGLVLVAVAYYPKPQDMQAQPINGPAVATVSEKPSQGSAKKAHAAIANSTPNAAAKTLATLPDHVLALAPQELAEIAPPALSWDAQGQLLVDYESRAWIEFFRSVPSDQQAQSARFQTAVVNELSSAQRAQLASLEQKYQQLLEAEYQQRQQYAEFGVDSELQLALQGKASDEQAWQHALEMVANRQSLRRQHLGDALADAWYSDDEAVENYTLAALSIARDPLLDEQQKAEQVAELDTLLPAAMRQSIEVSRQSADLTRDVAQWRRNGLQEQEISDAIALRYGAEVALRWLEAGSGTH